MNKSIFILGAGIIGWSIFSCNNESQKNPSVNANTSDSISKLQTENHNLIDSLTVLRDKLHKSQTSVNVVNDYATFFEYCLRLHMIGYNKRTSEEYIETKKQLDEFVKSKAHSWMVWSYVKDGKVIYNTQKPDGSVISYTE